ncbi:putative glycosyl transferase (plasmid) [Thermomicrobium roseum DSM 5159]|uniref:Putative glycosyl transferase n=1 Tax=Thermomicrobium roseum (strain ATCC 27502 / DSM 5159 / P-2) TaxID=309801 RepID=B9L439_THERP|nr:putative glycosyl transferase [Thermomicrobium roseum DSM 5159]
MSSRAVVIGTGRELGDGSGEVVWTRVAGEHDRASSPGRALVHARSVMRRRPELVQDLDQPADLA